MITRTRVCLSVLGLLLLAFLFDTQLIVLRDDGLFTLHYNVPDEMKGKMYAGASWYSDSFMCRHLSFGSGRFEGTEYGDAFDNVEEKPGEWVSHIPTKVWHPFCTWELGLLTIGMDANEERTRFYDLAYAYLLEETKSDFENPAKQKDFQDCQNEAFLVCDISEFDSEKIFPDKKYVEQRRSYECNNPKSQGSTHMSATPYVALYLRDSGKININFSINKILYITRNYYDNNKSFINSYNKNITFKNNEIIYIDSSLTENIFWKIQKMPDSYVLILVNAGLKEKNQTSVTITPEQLSYLASDNVWALPDFLQQ
ncbi:hypothetical protein [Desulfomicrobium escambiense]|uniref:hypothetical protein n=1 Tax=Desulfomicrobium escambiense TaxID=29503 RepID=UPI000402861A|nr:hypothetical protein [Desulfomicrobium escambiense]